jgi:hypothetical protein
MEDIGLILAIDPDGVPANQISDSKKTQPLNTPIRVECCPQIHA